jgi:hypothetical protein
MRSNVDTLMFIDASTNRFEREATMDPQFALEFHRRMEIERTRRLEYERVARERIDAMNADPREGWRSNIRRWWKSLRAVRVTVVSPTTCCPAPAICP